MKSLNIFTNKITYLLFLILITISWLSAIRSANLNIEYISNDLLIALLVLGLVIFVILKLFPKISKFFKKWQTLAVCSAIVFGFQLYFVLSSSTKIGYDVTSVYNAQWQPDDGFIKFYFSLNPNNLNTQFVKLS